MYLLNKSDITKAVIKAIGTPLKYFGILDISNLSLILANIYKTNVKPKEEDILYIRISIKLKLLFIFNKFIPNTAQFVVIRGKYKPKFLWILGKYFFNTISINWTIKAIIKINIIVFKYVVFVGTKIK